MKRKVITIEVLGQRLFGTEHMPSGQPASVSNTGILLVSFGHQPRSWVGDLGSHCADQLSAAGYRVFRFDMPGLGDSPGELPVHLEVLWSYILEGGHATYAAALAKELVRKYQLRQLVLGGFCGGCATALLACDPTANEIQGLILLEPEMGRVVLPNDASPQKVYEVNNVAGYLERKKLLARRLRSLSSWKKLLAGKCDLYFWGKLAPYIFSRISDKFRGRNLPTETNLPLLNRWQSCSKKRLPILVLTVGHPTRRRYYTSYGFKPGKSDRNTGLTWLEIEGTTHAMVSGGAKESIPVHIVGWMQGCFPLD